MNASVNYKSILFEISNTEDKNNKVILFGGNLFLLEKKYGSDAGINIKVVSPYFVDYTIILAESVYTSSKLKEIRIIGSREQINKGLRHLIKDASRQLIRFDLDFTENIREGNGKYKSFIRLNDKNIDGNTYFEFEALPYSNIIIEFIYEINPDDKRDVTYKKDVSFKITNISDESKNACLFGFTNMYKDNLGSETGIIVESLNDDLSLIEIPHHCFDFEKIEIESKAVDAFNFCIEAVHVNAFMNTYFQQPFYTVHFVRSDALYENGAKNILEIPLKLFINSGTYLYLNSMKPNNSIVMNFISKK